ncbi:MAG: hypothetical protein ACRC33_16745, partial [Gemmataceae bacterium]
GLRLRFLDAATGAARAGGPLVDGVADPGAWRVIGATAYHAHGGRLKGYALPSGRVVSDRPAGESGPARLEQDGRSLLAWPREGPAVRFVARWRWVAVQWRAGPWPGRADEVRSFPAEGTGPVTRLEPARLPRYRDGAAAGGLVPTFALDREAAAPGPVVQVGPGGVLCSLGDHVRSLQPLK